MTEKIDRGMPGRILQKVLPLLGVALLAAALWTLHRELEAYSINQITAAAGAIASGGLGLAVFLTFCDYAILTLYDFLALRYAGRRISYTWTPFLTLSVGARNLVKRGKKASKMGIPVFGSFKM